MRLFPKLPSFRVDLPLAHKRLRSTPTDVSAIVSEPDFLKMVDFERKRSERTGRPILLMLAELRESARLNGNLTRIAEALQASKREIDVLGWYASETTLGIIFTEIKQPDDAVLGSIRARVAGAIEATLGNHPPVRVTFSFHIFPACNNSGEIDLTFYPHMACRQGRRAALAKRHLDVIISALLLVLLFPLVVSIVLAVKLASRGPVLYKQRRVGQFGRPFTFLKFRSMYVNSDASIHEQYVTDFISGQATTKPDSNGNGVFKIVDDPRITPIGRFLRKRSMDELPQLLNVLRGDMSLVGPRPPLAYEMDRYSTWHRRRIIEAKPGITGLWQVSGRSKLTFNDMVRLDLAYIRNSSIWLDLWILLKTPIAAISGDGAY